MSILSLLYAVVVNALISCRKEKHQTWPILLTFAGLKLALCAFVGTTVVIFVLLRHFFIGLAIGSLAVICVQFLF